MTVDDFFSGMPRSQALFEALSRSVARIGQAEVRVTKSGISFWRKTPFAWVAGPDRQPRGDHATVVLALALRKKDPSLRWMEVVGPTLGLYTHRLRLESEADLDLEVRVWLQEAWSLAG